MIYNIRLSSPLYQIPEFSIYEDNRELHVKVCKYHETVALDSREIEILKRAHKAIFSQVLKIRASWLNCVFESAEKNYLVVPLRVVPPEISIDHSAPSLVVYIDIESASLLADMVPSSEGYPRPADSFKLIVWPMSVEKFNNAIVVLNHDDKHVLHEVKEVSKTVNLSSPFPDLSRAPTYLDYFTKKYGCSFTDDSQPALKCKVLGSSASYFQLLTSRFKSSGGEDIKKSSKRGRIIELFPELCSLYPLSANLWKLIRCLPSILWRVECILSVDNLHSRITRETGIGRLPDGSELTTRMNFTGYKDMGYGDLSTQKHIFYLHDDHQHTHQQREPEMVTLSACNPLDPPLRSPDNALLLQALTTKSAGDSVDLERLETLGDSFLKFSTTIFLFCDRFSAHEGRLTDARSRRVGNFNLYYLAKCRGIPQSIFSTTFDPHQMWIPPCFVFSEDDRSLQATPGACEVDRSDASSQGDQLVTVSAREPKCKAPFPASDHEKHYLFHKVTDKGVADCMESLIGAYLVSGGMLAGLKLMVWMGIKIISAQEPDEVATSTSKEEEEEGEIRDDMNVSPPFVRREVSLNTLTSEEDGEISDDDMRVSPPLVCRAVSPNTSTNEEGEIRDDDMTLYLPSVRREVSPNTAPLFVFNSSDSYAHPPCTKQQKMMVTRSSLFVRGSSTILETFFRLPPRHWSSDCRHQQEVELNRLLDIAVGRRDVISWRFKDRRLLLQALTHASYTKNRLTDSYQRLEFLGDAVLDYLITCHIYSTFPKYGPGKITSLRSALVNNITFAEMAVELKLNFALLHNSPSLFKQIELYLGAVKKCSEEDDSSHYIYDVSSSVNEKDQVCMYM